MLHQPAAAHTSRTFCAPVLGCMLRVHGQGLMALQFLHMRGKVGKLA